MLLQLLWSSFFWMNFISWSHYQAHPPREPCKMHYQNLLWHETTHSPYNPPAPLHSLGDCQDENTQESREDSRPQIFVWQPHFHWKMRSPWEQDKDRRKGTEYSSTQSGLCQNICWRWPLASPKEMHRKRDPLQWGVLKAEAEVTWRKPVRHAYKAFSSSLKERQRENACQ